MVLVKNWFFFVNKFCLAVRGNFQSFTMLSDALSGMTPNVVAYCRSCCIPTLYQREQRRKNTQIFIPRGKAAILAICSLGVRAYHSSFLPFSAVFSIFLFSNFQY